MEEAVTTPGTRRPVAAYMGEWHDTWYDTRALNGIRYTRSRQGRSGLATVRELNLVIAGMAAVAVSLAVVLAVLTFGVA